MKKTEEIKENVEKNNWLWFTPLFLKTIDFTTTEFIIENGGCELNPFMNYLFTTLGRINTYLYVLILYTFLSIIFEYCYNKIIEKVKIIYICNFFLFIFLNCLPIIHNILVCYYVLH